MVGENFKVKMEVMKFCVEKWMVFKLIVEVFMKRYIGDIVFYVIFYIFMDIVLDGKKGESKWSRMMVYYDIKEV